MFYFLEVLPICPRQKFNNKNVFDGCKKWNIDRVLIDLIDRA